MRWIVGDLQGCASEFEELLERIQFDRGRDELWAVGDLINRGPDSLAALQLWHDVGGRGVIGNHEIYALLVHAGRWPRKADTLDGLFGDPEVDVWMARLRALPALRFLPGDRESGVRDVWLIHAGIDPRWQDLHALAERLEAAPHDDEWLERDEVSFATRVRCCTAQGDRSRFDRAPEDCPPPHRPWDVFYAERVAGQHEPPRVVHGHWAWRGHYRSEHVIGLDSGCVYGGCLTAWCMEDDRVVQVASRSPRR
jgi:bis(5'-nucleosyl)-tetraphosphatase (symmetrical)